MTTRHVGNDGANPGVAGGEQEREFATAGRATHGEMIGLQLGISHDPVDGRVEVLQRNPPQFRRQIIHGKVGEGNCREAVGRRNSAAG